MKVYVVLPNVDNVQNQGIIVKKGGISAKAISQGSEIGQDIGSVIPIPGGGLIGQVVGSGIGLITGLFGGTKKVPVGDFLRKTIREVLDAADPGSYGSGSRGEVSLKGSYTDEGVQVFFADIGTQLLSLYSGGDDYGDLSQALSVIQYKTTLSGGDYALLSYNRTEPGNQSGGEVGGSGDVPGATVGPGATANRSFAIGIGLAALAVLAASR